MFEKEWFQFQHQTEQETLIVFKAGVRFVISSNSLERFEAELGALVDKFRI